MLHFLRLRADSHAQYEIREYSNVILDIVSKWVPLTYEAFINYRKDSINLSKTAVETIKRMLKGEKLSQESSGMSKREWSEFCDAFLNQK